MGEFFKGWRRKTGLVTLVLTMVLMVGWMRSFVINDHVLFGIGEKLHRFDSLHGVLCWMRGSNVIRINFEWDTYSPDACSEPWGEVGFYKGTWRLAGALSGPGQMPWYGEWNRVYVLALPYWLLVLPLTLLSAWLIIVRPRKVKPTTESTP